MKQTRKFLAVFSLVALVTSFVVMPASAATSGYTNSAYVGTSSSFNSEWEKTRTYKVGSTVIGYMTYGYDIDWINEDYVWTKSTECNSTAMLYRSGYDTSDCTGSEKGKNTYSKIEVTHKTYYVYYKVKFSATYSGVTYTTATSSIK